MAKILKLDPQQYFQGSITLTRGDDWALAAHIVDRINGLDLGQADLEGVACTGFLPNSDASAAPLSATGVINCDGRVSFQFPALATTAAALSRGIGMYAVLEDLLGLHTVFSPDQAIDIRDPGFAEY